MMFGARRARRSALSRRPQCSGPSGWLVANRMTKTSYSGYQFPPEIIHQAIWLYLRFTLSLRDVEDLLAERGITISYETVRRWVNHFRSTIAADLRKRRPRRYQPRRIEAFAPRRWTHGGRRLRRPDNMPTSGSSRCSFSNVTLPLHPLEVALPLFDERATSFLGVRRVVEQTAGVRGHDHGRLE